MIDALIEQHKEKVHYKIDRQCELWRFYNMSQRRGMMGAVTLWVTHVESVYIHLPMTIEDIFNK
jgi:hypothetical protein